MLRWSLAALAVVTPAALVAQIAPIPTPMDTNVDADTLRPKTYTTPGASESVARSLVLALAKEQRQRDLCWQLGCLVILNESPSYRVTGFYVSEGLDGGRHRWSRNQFGSPLGARKATLRFKTGLSDCERPVRFVLEKTKGKERFEIEDRANFCSTPHVDSLLRIKVYRPHVSVE